MDRLSVRRRGLVTVAPLIDAFNRSGDENASPEHLDDLQRLRQARDHLRAAWAAIGYVMSGDLDDSLTRDSTARFRKWACARDLAEHVELIDSAVQKLALACDLNPKYLTRSQGEDGKSYPSHTGRVDGELIRSLRETGLSMRAIADKVGCSLGTVHRLCSNVQGPQLSSLNA